MVRFVTPALTRTPVSRITASTTPSLRAITRRRLSEPLRGLRARLFAAHRIGLLIWPRVIRFPHSSKLLFALVATCNTVPSGCLQRGEARRRRVDLDHGAEAVEERATFLGKR